MKKVEVCPKLGTALPKLVVFKPFPNVCLLFQVMLKFSPITGDKCLIFLTM